MDGQDLRTSLGRNIKQYRNRYGFSQEKLAEKADISTNFLSDIETGKKWPSPDTITKIARALHADPCALFRSDEALPPEVAEILKQYAKESLGLVRQSLDDLVRYYRRQVKG